MVQINQLSRADSLKSGDLFVLFATNQGDARATSLTSLQAYMQDNLVFTEAAATVDTSMVTQYASPSASGFNITMTDSLADNLDIHLILSPTAGYAEGTITFPPVASVVDKQILLITTTQQINSLTIDGNGATSVLGVPASMAADDFLRFKFDEPTQNYYRVG